MLNTILYSVLAIELELIDLSNRSKSEFKVWFPNYYSILFFASRQTTLIIGGILVTFLVGNIYLLKKLISFLRPECLFFKKEYLLSLFSIVVTLATAEVVLRLAGHEPSFGNNTWFRPVSELKLYQGVIGDSLGHFKASPKAIDRVNKDIEKHLTNNIKESYDNFEDDQFREIYGLKTQFLDLHFGKIDNELSKKVSQIEGKDPAIHSELDKAIMTYIHNPLNKDGFRSIPFKPCEGQYKKILLLGDSFTWGHSASPITNSFADILLCNDLMVYNTGMSGTDPAYYLSLAEYYIPRIKPDVVIVNFFLGNDIQYYKKDLMPGYPAFIPTNAGNLFSCVQGIYFDNPKELYRLNCDLFYMPYLSSFGERVLRRTVIGTFIINIINQSRRISPLSSPIMHQFKDETDKLKTSSPNANEKCSKIREICEKNETRFILSIIPDLKKSGLTRVSDYDNLFPDQDYHRPASLSQSDYRVKDGHFNNDGHRKYAEFLLKLIKDE